MNFQEAIQKIEERGFFNRYAEVKPIFDERLEELEAVDHTDRGLCYYYLLLSYLKANLVHETEEAHDYYEEMNAAFLKQEQVYWKKLKSKEAHGYEEEITDFYQLMERCYSSLVLLYDQKGFEKMQVAYRQKMDFRRHLYRFQGRYFKWAIYKAIGISSGYGTNLWRWGLTTLAFCLFMAFAFFGLDLMLDENMRTLPENTHFLTYFYFASTTLTSVGYGDIVPVSIAAQMLAVFESFLGFLMLGIFIGMIKLRVI